MSRTQLKTGPSNANQSTKKLMNLLEVMSQNQGPMRLYDIAEQCGMPPTTTLRFLTTLQSMGYVTQSCQTNHYSLTHKICRLGFGLQKPGDLRNISMPYLESLSAAFNAKGSLAIEDDMSVLYLETIYPKSDPDFYSKNISNVADLHCTAAGKLFLINYTQTQWEQLLAIKGLARKTPKTITSLERLQKELILARINGFAYDDEECEHGLCCVAAPIRDYTNNIIAALTLSGPAPLMAKSHIQANLPLLLEAVSKISLYMGYDKSLNENAIYRR